MIINLSIILLIFSNNAFIIPAEANEFKLELVQVLFRHGERTATKMETYKNDPYSSIFREYGYGQLTLEGKQREYKLGKMLRKRYHDFLGETNPKQVYAFSSDSDRTKMSLQLVLAGLYPPTAKTAWNKDIPWIPIPTYYKEVDYNFLNSMAICPTYLKLFEEVQNSVEIKEKLKKYEPFIEHLRNATGITDTRLFAIFLIYNNIQGALNMGLSFPEWMNVSDYDILKELSIINFDCSTHTKTLRRMAVGPIIDEFLKNIKNSENNSKINENEKKIYLYSGHEINLANFNSAHNMINAPKFPNYGSAIMIEKLRGKDNQIYIRFVMWTGVTEELITLKMKNCNVECPLADYLKIMEEVFPDEEVRRCYAIDKKCHKR